METVHNSENTRRGDGAASHRDNKSVASSGMYDIISVGFGPAALSIAIAMRDRGIPARVLFLERQSEFGWHTGMLLPGTKMQISFLKDLATMRDPRSHFTFLNYLHVKGRLVHFTNLSTHTPLREEFNDYMKWCASHFNDLVQYNQEVVSVTAAHAQPGWAAEHIKVTTRDVLSGEVRELSAKNVVVANGGEQAIPASFPKSDLCDTVIHSSAYLKTVPKLLEHESAPYRLAVIGGGQSAVEICEDLASRYPKSKIDLIIRSSSLRPSDDSPFVNEIFDPSSVDEFYSLDPSTRQKNLAENKATNYSVVRLPLLEGLYEKLYRQKLLEPNSSNWPLRLTTNREVCGLKELPSEATNHQVQLRLKNMQTGEMEVTSDKYDLVVLATGYQRDPFAKMLEPLKPMLYIPTTGERFHVDRNYRLSFLQGKVRRDAGVWLQGCCESSHGLSDSLLSILAVRGAGILDSIVASNKRATEESARL